MKQLLVRHPPGSFVYAVRLPNGIKIGKTDNPVSTLNTFRRPCPDAHYVNVWFFHDVPTAFAVEQYLHDLLVDDWIGGELFKEIPGDADWFERASQSILKTLAWLRALPQEQQRRIEASVRQLPNE